tara:strand:+ start:78 stop:269 length:192 start_codon:yes stop_codon:yes gene_type:complete
MPKKKSKEEQSHILSYTKPKGIYGSIYPIYDEQGYFKYAKPEPTFHSGEPIKIEIKKVIVSFD